MKVAAIQTDIVWEDPPANFAHLTPAIARSVDLGARLVVLPEMFSTGFSMATDKIAEPEGGPSETFLKEQATKHRIWLGGSCPVAPMGSSRPFNRFVLVSPEGESVHYDKIHPFGYGGEADHYAAGSKRVTLEIDGIRCTLFVCYDLRFADWFWDAAEETDCYLVPANWPAARQQHWRSLLQARAIENLAYVVGVNRVGPGGDISYAGGTLVVGPFGEILFEAGREEAIVVADLDAARVASTRSKYPFLSDRGGVA